jgi:predicted oxidoreductase
VNGTLKNLGVDYIDILLIHRPSPLMDPDSVAKTLIELRDAGLVRHFGVSNFTSSQYNLLASRLPFPLVTNQIEMHPLLLDPLHVKKKLFYFFGSSQIPSDLYFGLFII